MDNAKLTVYFDEPFWVGVFERIENGKLSVSKVTFGAEPKDYEIRDFVLKNYNKLKFSPAVDVIVKTESSNPKRLQREARKQTLQKGIGTKSQQALQLQREEMKTERQTLCKEQREAQKSICLISNNRNERKSTGADSSCVFFCIRNINKKMIDDRKIK